MCNPRLVAVMLVSTFGAASWSIVAAAQEGVDQGGATTGSGATGGGGGTTVVVQQAPPTITNQTVLSPFGPPPTGSDVADTEPGGYQFGLGGAGSTAAVRGGANAAYLTDQRSSMGVPMYHRVQRGDTLWDLCSHYHGNPYAWPRVWSYNPQIENPHWIYPGDRVRMREGSAAGTAPGGDSFVSRTGMVPKGTVFLRDRGYIDDEVKDVWGTLEGSPDDQMLLAAEDEIYLKMKDDRDVRVGQEFTIFRKLRKPEEGDAKGWIIAVQGTARVTTWNKDTHVARATIIESLDIIERGALVGPVGRRFDVVPPVQNDREVWATVVAAFEPREIIGQHQLVFINKGRKDGLRAGNRLFVVEQGDRWRATLQGVRGMAAHQMRYELRRAEVEPAAGENVKSKELPREVIGEIIVLRPRQTTSLAVVTFSQYELAPGAVVVARRGY